MDWNVVLPLNELPPGSMKARQGLLLIHHDDGKLYATENACPHQGYPLSQGSLTGCLLTCTWHNFKFDIRDGKCVMGEESLRTHPIRVRDGMIEVQRDRSVDLSATWASLDQGLRRAQVARSSREVARLLLAGVPPARLLVHAVCWDTNHGEYGVGHSGALAADLLGWMALPPTGMGADEHRVQLVGEVMELAARTVLGLPERARPPAEAPGEGAAEELARRVEAEDAVGAEALLRGMIQAGWDFPRLEAAIYPILAEHFLDFGHPYIYLGKYRELIEAAGWEWADPLLGGMIFGVSNGTREELLPPWASFRSRWKKFAEAGGPERALAARIQGRGGVSDDLVAAVAHGSPGDCFSALSEALLAGRW
ncbi:MAG TPA: Rieske 2Fe-2S domain-containing protein, partial [Myxococcota bacterium]|nr:Rieske 2Fe-2S domain-containing protein [Myxococcota bacterium]